MDKNSQSEIQVLNLKVRWIFFFFFFGIGKDQLYQQRLTKGSATAH